jgi:hypothetical protein
MAGLKKFIASCSSANADIEAMNFLKVKHSWPGMYIKSSDLLQFADFGNFRARQGCQMVGIFSKLKSQEDVGIHILWPFCLFSGY